MKNVHVSGLTACVVLSYTPVLVVFGLIGWPLLSHLVGFAILAPTYSPLGIAGAVLSVVVMAALGGILVAAYLRATFTSPGHVSATLLGEATFPTREFRLDGNARFCAVCSCPKPDRTHHCSTCGVCVLRMDHHCPWINNCVGYRNHKHFTLFLAYIPIAGLWHVATTLVALRGRLIPTGGGFSPVEVNLGASAIIAAAFGGTMLCFGGYHLHLLAANKTSLESMGAAPLPPPPPGVTPPPATLWDLGTEANFAQVMGGKRFSLLWLIPTHPRLECSGFEWPSRFPPPGIPTPADLERGGTATSRSSFGTATRG